MDTFPDLQVLLDDLRRGTDAIEYHWTLVGTHLQTGNHVRVSGYEVWELGDEVIRKSDGHFDQAEYDKQVARGAAPSSKLPPRHFRGTAAAVDRHSGARP